VQRTTQCRVLEKEEEEKNMQNKTKKHETIIEQAFKIVGVMGRAGCISLVAVSGFAICQSHKFL
jgi:hypothetical protein